MAAAVYGRCLFSLCFTVHCPPFPFQEERRQGGGDRLCWTEGENGGICPSYCHLGKGELWGSPPISDLPTKAPPYALSRPPPPPLLWSQGGSERGRIWRRGAPKPLHTSLPPTSPQQGPHAITPPPCSYAGPQHEAIAPSFQARALVRFRSWSAVAFYHRVFPFIGF